MRLFKSGRDASTSVYEIMDYEVEGELAAQQHTEMAGVRVRVNLPKSIVSPVRRKEDRLYVVEFSRGFSNSHSVGIDAALYKY